jgi:hypothetical protein
MYRPAIPHNHSYHMIILFLLLLLPACFSSRERRTLKTTRSWVGRKDEVFSHARPEPSGAYEPKNKH